MPKTNEKDAYYFPHDCNARNDPKILALRSVFGAEGYGVYFMLVEILREQSDYKLPVTKYTWNTLAMQMQVDATRVEEIVSACVCDFGLFALEDDVLYSPSLLRRMEKADSISTVRREAAKKRWESQKTPENGPCKDAGCAGAMQKQSKSRAIKEKKSREEERKTEQTERKGKENIFAAFAAGDGDLLAALQGFEAMRVKIKKPMTDRAKALMLNELTKLSQDPREQVAILDQSTRNCWQGVFPLKDSGAAGSRPGRATSEDKIGALQDLYQGFGGDIGDPTGHSPVGRGRALE